MIEIACAAAGHNNARRMRVNSQSVEAVCGDAVSEVLAAGIYATGLQLYVEHAGSVAFDDAAGRCADRQLDRRSLHSGYCLTKPLLSVGLALLVDAGQLTFDDHVRAIDDGIWWVDRETRVRDVLSHDAGLDKPPAMTWRMTTVESRASLLEMGTRGRPAYSEIAGWLAIERIVESIVGQTAGEFLHDALIGPLGLEDGLFMTSPRALQALADGRVLVPVGGLPVEEVPLLSELLPCQVGEARPAFGGLVSMSAMGRFYTALKDVLSGACRTGLPSPETLARLVESRNDPRWDGVLRKTCAFAGGFMSHFADHGVSGLSGNAIGHVAGVSNAIAFCDPEVDVALALYLNGVSLNADDLMLGRQLVVQRIIGALEP